MKNLLIIYHSQSGGTASMAEAVHRGCSQEDDVKTRFLRVIACPMTVLKSQRVMSKLSAAQTALIIVVTAATTATTRKLTRQQNQGRIAPLNLRICSHCVRV